MSTPLGPRVQALREKQGLSQEQLAARADVSRSTIQNIETGRRVPRPASLQRIAHALGTDVPALTRDGSERDGRDGLEELLEMRRQLDAAIQRLEQHRPG